MNIALEGYLNIGLALLVIGLSIPLALRKVPMNHVYGFRTKRAFESEKNWYDINAAGGKTLALWTLPLLIAGIIQALAPKSPGPIYGYLSFSFIFLPLGCLWACWRERKKHK